MGMSFPHVLRLLCLILLLSQVACRYSPPSPPFSPIRLSTPPPPVPRPPPPFEGRFGDMPRRPPPPPPARSGRP
ncbi:hypothetical protein C5167_042983 [Papaver somniferum]|uniref:Uncharacterized protein n=1 Tax=Papaver somniferum TaxID=3469 RepID=A0A4Y7L813_PAPSO|nr:hypothetical protein C5167_042983 [Papaver somniferum]